MKRALVPLAVIAALAGPAAGDWLVPRDGAPLETRGPWEVRGERVVFTLPNGTLSSMPLGEVDLDESAKLTAARKAPPAAARAEAKPRAVWKIDGDDVPRARPPADAQDEPPTGETGAAAGPRGFLDGLQVVHWEKVERPLIDGVEVVGQIRNANRSVAARLVVTVRLFDEDGAPVASGQAFLDADALPGGRTMGFRRLFEGVLDFATAEFEVSAVEILLGASSRPAETESQP